MKKVRGVPLAVLLVGSLAQAQDAATLIKSLGGEAAEWKKADAALLAMGEAAVDPLFAELASRESPRRTQVASLLGRLAPRVPRIVPLLVAAFRDEAGAPQLTISAALSEAGVIAVAPCEAALAGEDPARRICGAFALGLLNKSVPAADRARIADALGVASQSEDAVLRTHARLALAAHGRPLATDPGLTDGLALFRGSEDQAVAAWLAFQAIAAPDVAVLQGLVTLLLSGELPKTADLKVCLLLGRNSKAMRPLIPRLAEAAAVTDKGWALFLGPLLQDHKGEAIPAIRKVLRSKEHSSRANATALVTSLGADAGPLVPDLQYALLRHDLDKTQADNFVMALTLLGEKGKAALATVAETGKGEAQKAAAGWMALTGKKR